MGDFPKFSHIYDATLVNLQISSRDIFIGSNYSASLEITHYMVQG